MRVRKSFARKVTNYDNNSAKLRDCLQKLRKISFATRFLSVLFRYVLVCLLLLTGFRPAPAHAQDLYERALHLRLKKENDKALALMQRLARQRPSSSTIQSTCGEWLYEAGRYAEAAAIFEAAMRNVPKGGNAFALPLARCRYRAGDPQAALRVLQDHPAAAATPEGRKLSTGARWAADALAAAPLVLPVEMGPRINSPYPELFPQRSADGQFFYFTRRIRGIDEDLMRCIPDSCGGWLLGRPLPAPPNTPRQESALAISPDGHYLFFSRSEIKSADGWSGGGSDLYMAYIIQPNDTVWSTPQPFGGTINTPAFEGSPCLSADSRTLYFSSDRPGGHGGLDLWYSRFQHGVWGEPHNMGAEINTPGNETAPFLCADGQTLYFISDGQPLSLGGRDIYRASRRDTLWSGVKNLGVPINSPYDEASISVTASGDSAFFASDRQGPAGNFDIWVSPVPEGVRPRPSLVIRGRVYDSLSSERLEYAHIFLSDGATGSSLGDFTSNGGDGSFTAFIEPRHKYILEATRVGYTSVSDTFSFDTVSTGEVNRPYPLLPDGYVAPTTDTVLLTLHFGMNVVNLSDSARDVIRAVVKPYAADSRAQLMVNGYTDNTGTPMLNEQISSRRASLVGSAASAAGFPVEHIQTQGWGDVQPVAPNDTEESRALNRRVELILRH